MGNFMKKWWPIIVTLVGGLSSIISPYVQDFWKDHTTTVATLTTIWAAFKFLMPSPIANNPSS